MPEESQASLDLLRETENELVFGVKFGFGWASFAIGLGIMATGLGQSFLERTIKPGPLLSGAVLAALGFLFSFWASKLTFHLDNRTYSYRQGFLFSPRRTQGSLDELRGITVSSDEEYSITGTRTVWAITVWFRTGKVIDLAAFEPNEAKAYRAAKRFASLLGVPVLDSDGKETPCNKL